MFSGTSLIYCPVFVASDLPVVYVDVLLMKLKFLMLVGKETPLKIKRFSPKHTESTKHRLKHGLLVNKPNAYISLPVAPPTSYINPFTTNIAGSDRSILYITEYSSKVGYRPGIHTRY
jgi:hypothetical protein